MSANINKQIEMSESKRKAQPPTRNFGYSVVDNTALEDSRLSWKAKAIITYIVGKPIGWKCRISDLVKKSKDGKGSVQSAIKELKKYGYAELIVERDPETGQFADQYLSILDRPMLENPQTENPPTENRQTVNPQTVNPPTEKPKVGKTESRKTRKTEKPKVGKSAPNNNTSSNKDYQKEQYSRRGADVDLFGDDRERESKFKNSLAHNQETFCAGLKKYADAGVDLDHYHAAILNWSNRKRITRTADGWIATAENWIKRDADDGKLVTVPGVELANSTDQKLKDFHTL